MKHLTGALVVLLLAGRGSSATPTPSPSVTVTTQVIVVKATPTPVDILAQRREECQRQAEIDQRIYEAMNQECIARNQREGKLSPCPLPPLQGCDQLGKCRQAFWPKAVAQRGWHPIGPADRQGYPPRWTSLADEDPLRPRAAPLEDDRQSLAGQRVERMSDDDRVRNRTRLGRTGPMPGLLARRAL